MRRKNSRISKRLKAEILTKALEPGCVKMDLVRSYGISKVTLYKWISQQRNNSLSVNKADLYSKPANQFIELKVASPKGLKLEKASLVFADLSLMLEGSISSKKLISIFKILEEEQC